MDKDKKKKLNVTHSSAGTWHGGGKELEIYYLLFPKNRDGDNFIVDSAQELVDSQLWPNRIDIHVQCKDKQTGINNIAAVQFALNLINNYDIKTIEKAMLKYIEEEMPEKLI